MNQRPEPFFITGIAHRSGTNYLHSLILMHPDCVQSRANGEDFLLSHSHLLTGYVRDVAAHWNPVWGNDPDRLMKSLEKGLLEFITPENSTALRMVNKTPVPDHAANFTTLFSSGVMVLLVRNGQDLTESYTRSFNYRFEYALRQWIKGAEEICSILKNAEPARIRLVRYEDLVPDPEKELRSIFSFAGLDAGKYDYEKARSADVVGSSDVRIKTGDLNWKPVKKQTDFNPLGRAAGWSRWKHYRFNFLAGDVAKKLGYDLSFPEKGLFYYGYNFFASAYYHVHLRIFRCIHALKAMQYGKQAMIKAYQKEF
jgi:hypothetical protein